MQFFNAIKCGYLAFEETRLDQPGSVIGITSHGIFIHTSNNRIIFLSSENFDNPLNINLHPFPSILRDLQVKDQVILGNGKIIFPRLDFQVSTSPQIVYKPEPAPQIRQESNKIKKNILAIITEINRAITPEGFASQLPAYINNGESNTRETKELAELREIHMYLQEQSAKELCVSLTRLIGSGRGLTPAGDDLVCGFLLAINRWEMGKFRGDELKELNLELSKEAYQKTTTLSANLIELASQGEGDERLIIILDSIYGADPSPHEAAKLLLTYGSSSGLDAFTGMVIAII
jgi:hypothetical protein